VKSVITPWKIPPEPSPEHGKLHYCALFLAVSDDLDLLQVAIALRSAVNGQRTHADVPEWAMET
jgi:hypothetical protein